MNDTWMHLVKSTDFMGRLGCEIFGCFLLSFPQNERKIYKLSKTNIFFVFREREEKKANISHLGFWWNLCDSTNLVLLRASYVP